MEAVVSDILRTRMREPDGLRSTTVVSLAGHAVALAALALMPGILPHQAGPPPVVMTISLGGSPGPKTGGLTELGGRNMQAAEPTVAPKVERAPMPPTRTEPAMVLPVPDPRVRPRTPPKQTAVSKDPAGRPEGRAAETQKGSAPVETGARGMGFGLSSGGGGGTGSHLDVQNFCCPEYLTTMTARIRSNWQERQQAVGTVLMKFVIQRSGELTDVQVERSSNIFALDQASSRALYLTARLPPLPAQFPEDHLTVHLEFEYQR